MASESPYVLRSLCQHLPNNKVYVGLSTGRLLKRPLEERRVFRKLMSSGSKYFELMSRLPEVDPLRDKILRHTHLLLRGPGTRYPADSVCPISPSDPYFSASRWNLRVHRNASFCCLQCLLGELIQTITVLWLTAQAMLC